MLTTAARLGAIDQDGVDGGVVELVDLAPRRGERPDDRHASRAQRVEEARTERIVELHGVGLDLVHVPEDLDVRKTPHHQGRRDATTDLVRDTPSEGARDVTRRLGHDETEGRRTGIAHHLGVVE